MAITSLDAAFSLRPQPVVRRYAALLDSASGARLYRLILVGKGG